MAASISSIYVIKTLDRITRLDFIGPITLSDIWQVLRQQSGRPTYQFSERYHHELNHIGSRLHETSWAQFQYPIRHLIIKILWSLEAARLVIWIIWSLWNLTGARQHSCRGTCQISEWSDNSKHKSLGFETSWDLTIRHLIRCWYRALKVKTLVCLVNEGTDECFIYHTPASDSDTSWQQASSQEMQFEIFFNFFFFITDSSIFHFRAITKNLNPKCHRLKISQYMTVKHLLRPSVKSADQLIAICYFEGT